MYDRNMNIQIESLLIERDGYLKRNLKDRAAAVDAELERLGHKSKKISASAEIESATIEPVIEKATVKRASKKSR
jgi:hypothetical protein